MHNNQPHLSHARVSLQEFFPLYFFNSYVFFMTPSLWLTMITFAGASLCVFWQGWAGITQQTLAVLLIVFYVSLQMAMNVALFGGGC